jgi:glutathione S-transferase
MALKVSNTEFEHREIELKAKPPHLLAISPKGTVPVLWIQKEEQQEVIEQSLEIMTWALQRSDPERWLIQDRHQNCAMYDLIKKNDEIFKFNLDRYKYPHRYNVSDPIEFRQNGELFLRELNNCLEKSQYLMGQTRCLADVALMPFVRQFSKVDVQWFEQLPYEKLKSWLSDFENSDLFVSIMSKSALWVDS